MSIFNQKSKFKIKTEIRRVQQPDPPTASSKKPKATSVPSSGRASPAAPPGLSRSSSAPRASPNPSSLQHQRKRPHAATTTSSSVSPPPETKRYAAQTRSKPRAGRRRPAASGSPAGASPRLSDSEPDDDDDWSERLYAHNNRWKRARTEPADPARRLRHPCLWTGEADGQEGREGYVDAEKVDVVHAAEVASLELKCQPVMGLGPEEVAVGLRYPGSNFLERYELVWGKDMIDGAVDIMKVVKQTASIYLTDEEAKPFLDPNDGIYRRLEKSKNTGDGKGFKAALEEYNDRLLALQRKGVIAKNIDAMQGVPPDLVELILSQVYDRTVAPRVELLAKYENGTDNVYGELLHPFISDIFERTRLTSDMVFVDLGSGVGNVVLQAALERGCESWGCEMMENACNLADKQEREFVARCRLWGIAPGQVRLERGDFRTNAKTLAALKRADVVLVNNQAFTSQLNDHLVNMFLDLKIGCKIVSLKTFVYDSKIAENDVASSILDVEHLTYPKGYVSWTAAPGSFCISTRK